MKVWVVTSCEGCNSHTEKRIKDVIDIIQVYLEENAEYEDEDFITIKSKIMTEKEYDNLPDYVGP